MNKLYCKIQSAADSIYRNEDSDQTHENKVSGVEFICKPAEVDGEMCREMAHCVFMLEGRVPYIALRTPHKDFFPAAVNEETKDMFSC